LEIINKTEIKLSSQTNPEGTDANKKNAMITE
jgi:hypothetical protein